MRVSTFHALLVALVYVLALTDVVASLAVQRRASGSSSSSGGGGKAHSPTGAGSSSKGKEVAYGHVSTELTLGRPGTGSHKSATTSTAAHTQQHAAGQSTQPQAHRPQGPGRLGHLVQNVRPLKPGAPIGRRPTPSGTKTDKPTARTKYGAWWNRPGGKPNRQAGTGDRAAQRKAWREAKAAKQKGPTSDHPSGHEKQGGGGGRGPGSPNGGGHGQAVGG